MNPQAMLTPAEFEANARRTMAGFDDLPGEVRAALRDCLQYVPDTAVAFQLFSSGRATAAQLVEMIRAGELACHRDGVADGIVPEIRGGPRGANFRMVRRAPLGRYIRR